MIRNVNLQRALLGMLIGAVFGSVFAWARLAEVPVTETLELAFVDWRYRLHAHSKPISDDIVVVEFGERTLLELRANGALLGVHRWPYAALIESLHALGARAIAIDITLKREAIADDIDEDPLARPTDPAESLLFAQDIELANALATAGNVVVPIDAPDCDGLPEECARVSGQLSALVPYFGSRIFPVKEGEPRAVYGPTLESATPFVDFPDGTVLPFARAVGFVGTRHTQRHDPTLRTFAPLVGVDRWVVPDFAFAAAVLHGMEPRSFAWGMEALPPRDAFGALPAATVTASAVNLGNLSIPVDERGYAWIRWRTVWNDPEMMRRKIDAWTIIRNHEKILFDPESVEGLDTRVFKDKVVLVGYTAQGHISDFVTTPLGSQPGIFRHVAVIDTVLQQDWLRSPRRSTEALLTILLATIAGALVLGMPTYSWQEAPGPLGPMVMSAWKLAPGAAVLVIFAVTAVAVFDRGWVVSMLHPGGAVVASTMFATGFAYVFTRREREEARRKSEQALAVARRALSPAVVDEILRDNPGGVPNLGGERYHLTVYFSDIAGFTSISEKMSPEQLIAVLNEYLTRVTELLVRQGANIDKYIGDAVMAFWGAPIRVEDGPVRACLAAIDAIAAIEAFSAELVARGLTPLKTRIGINSGPAVAGGVGHPDYKYNYTAMGDTVNLASRLEGANKAYGTTCMLGPETYEGAKHVVLARELDLVRVKGKKIPVRVYELMGRASDPLPKERRIKERYEAALEAYRSRRFVEARAAFAELAESEQDAPSAAMVANCDERIADPPPEGWDGSNELHEK